MWGEWQPRTVEFRGEPVEYYTRSRVVDEVSQDHVFERKAVSEAGEQLFSSQERATLLPPREIEL
ncbi:MAG: hypothetical protein J07HB67_00618, partial [halophilic archaeon J07HB67]